MAMSTKGVAMLKPTSAFAFINQGHYYIAVIKAYEVFTQSLTPYFFKYYGFCREPIIKEIL
jgi:hypothetical protein